MGDAVFEEKIETLPLVDHHCHGVVRGDLGRAAFESLLTEADEAGELGGSLFHSRIGFAVRRWCAPVLDLPVHADPEDYLARRAELGAAEVNRRFLRAAGLEALCVDTGYIPDSLLEPAELGGLADAPAHEILRLETLAEEVVADGVGASAFAGEVRTRLEARAPRVAGFKSIAAYRAGLELSGKRPSGEEVTKAAGRLLRDTERGLAGCDAPPRIQDEVLHRFLVWCACDIGLPIQFHVGYGDAEADLRRGDPLLLTGLLQELSRKNVPVMLLHNYPFHRNAGYLAQVFPNVFVDVSLGTHNLGDRAPVILAELMELAPFGKVLFASDAYGLPELFHLGALQFRRGLGRVLAEGVAEGSWTERDAARVAEMIASGNARRAYRLDERF
ncbi:amidohydrolase family protein [Actinomadura sp. NPDC047616]|uniref:amidohydrolase family protein n=1 Tax=Actinomadura sp. NPDC047616 TaxID=3155914 RepID=UPI0033F568F6